MKQIFYICKDETIRGVFNIIDGNFLTGNYPCTKQDANNCLDRRENPKSCRKISVEIKEVKK